MFMCEIKYLDYKDKRKVELPWIDYGIDFFPTIMRVAESYKIKPYKYEEEIRGIIYSKEKRKGIPVRVNLKELVEYIYLSPFANEETNSKTENLLTKVFNKNIIRKSIIL